MEPKATQGYVFGAIPLGGMVNVQPFPQEEWFQRDTFGATLLKLGSTIGPNLVFVCFSGPLWPLSGGHLGAFWSKLVCYI